MARLWAGLILVTVLLFGLVVWDTANTFHDEAALLPNNVQQRERERINRIAILYSLGLAGLVVSLPWGILLFTRLKETQKQLQRENREREVAVERLESVLLGVRCIVWDADVTKLSCPPNYHWVLQMWNESVAQSIVPLEAPEGKYIDAWLQSRQEDQEQLDHTSAEAFRTGRTGYVQEYRCRDRYGAIHWLREDVHIEPLGPGHWRAIGVCTDITARKEAEIRVQAVTRELERSNTALQEFASIASHDLKEPLRKIQTFGSMLERKTEGLPPDAKGYLDRILAAAARMQALIDGLLSYSRVATKGAAFERTDIYEVLRGVLADLEVRIQETGATIEVAPLPSIYADAVQMRQLFQNLIGNSLKFHREGVPPHIKIGCTVRDGKNVITFADNGLGFEPQDAERIFEMFERVGGAGREGSGIGLAICRKIAERHGGTLTATGTPGEGATFILTLPRTG